MNKELEDALARWVNSKAQAEGWVRIEERDRKELDRLRSLQEMENV